MTATGTNSRGATVSKNGSVLLVVSGNSFDNFLAIAHQNKPKSDRIRTANSSATQSSARVVKLVDTRDLKSLDFTVVPVRFRLRAPKLAT